MSAKNASRQKTAQLPSPDLGAGHLAVDEQTIANTIGMSLAWVRKDRRTKRLLPFIRIGRSIRYSPAAVARALAAAQEGGATC